MIQLIIYNVSNHFSKTALNPLESGNSKNSLSPERKKVSLMFTSVYNNNLGSGGSNAQAPLKTSVRQMVDS